MSKDQSIISRRVALGAIITALTVSPFMLYAWRRKRAKQNHLFLPNELLVDTVNQEIIDAQGGLYQYFLVERKNCDYEAKVISNQQSCKLPIHPIRRGQSQFQLLTCIGSGQLASLNQIVPDNIVLFQCMAGRASVDGSNNGLLSLSIDRNYMRSIDYSATPRVIEEQYPTKNYDFSFSNSRLSDSIDKDSTLRRWAEKIFFFSYPQKNIHLGDTFQTSQLLPGIQMTAKVSSVVKIGEVKAVKITISKQLENPELQSYFDSTGEHLVTAKKTETSLSPEEISKLYDEMIQSVEGDKEATQLLLKTKNEALGIDTVQVKNYFYCNIFLDINTGVIIQQEEVLQIGDTSNITVYQRRI